MPFARAKFFCVSVILFLSFASFAQQQATSALAKPVPASTTEKSPPASPSPAASDVCVPVSPSPQDSAPVPDESLAEIAARAKAAKTVHAKKVIDDDNLNGSIGPLPRLKTNQAENGEAVVAALAEYRASHTPEQTEEVVRRWYQEYDSELAGAIAKNQDITATRDATMTYDSELCQYNQDYDPDSYRKCQAERMADIRGARQDRAEMTRNSQWILRLQHSLINIRVHLEQMGLRYDWFKIRTTNGVDRF